MTAHPPEAQPSDAKAPTSPDIASRFPAAYARLRAMAARLLGGEREDHTLEATALVHEAFLRLADGGATFASDDHFIAIAAQQMRRVLVDHARRTNALKRNGGRRPASIDSSLLAPPAETRLPIDLADFDDLLRRLESLEPRQARLVELHLFGDLPIERVAAMLDISERTAFSDWRMARAWLLAHLRA